MADTDISEGFRQLIAAAKIGDGVATRITYLDCGPSFVQTMLGLTPEQTEAWLAKHATMVDLGRYRVRREGK